VSPDDLRLVVAHARRPKREFLEDRWAYAVACSLLAPTTEKKWEFLRRCAPYKFDDSWVDAGAIQTLILAVSRVPA
jgi:hypothetical protein